MFGLTAGLLGRACQIFLAYAYPDGAIPESRRAFLNLLPDDPLEPLLEPPLCQRLYGTPAGATELRGYALRLGSSAFPHVKLKIVWHYETSRWFFAVDTHDAIHLTPGDPDHQRFKELQGKNRRLKQQIERAWEQAGVLTFNASLRQELSLQTDGALPAR